ncbi:MAG: class II fumarate hydratase [Candidatus Sericytochromatia bacterium]|nr:class II fumarate hydratase [Candidatus Sericytochromatia bacterium]
MMTRSIAWRNEVDALGDVKVPRGAYYGAATARAVGNFPVSGVSLPLPLIRAMALIKAAVAEVHGEMGLLDEERARFIVLAAEEVASGALARHFPVDVFQTGSGTSSHMNVNEVVARRAIELAGPRLGTWTIHPNDHVNLGQSSNDVFPSAIHLAVVEAMRDELRPALERMAGVLEEHARAWHDILKLGRTHLMDATPIRLGQEFGGYAAQVRMGLEALQRSTDALLELPLGGTAVGTGVNGHPDVPAKACAVLSRRTGLSLRPAHNPVAAVAARDALVHVSGTVRSVAVAAGKIAGDIRLLGSGPRGGLGELQLPALQPGSSLMPGKVNPVLCESVLQVVAHVIGCDAAVVQGGLGGVLELNTMMPMMATRLLEAVTLLARVVRQFTLLTLVDLRPVPERCAMWLEQSLALVTALTPALGYDKAAALAGLARRSGRTLREVVQEEAGLEPHEVERLLDAAAMCAPDAKRVGHGGG